MIAAIYERKEVIALTTPLAAALHALPRARGAAASWTAPARRIASGWRARAGRGS
jgi:hypothetical protein